MTTEYVVLRQQDGDEGRTWIRDPMTVEATDARDAIRKVAGDKGGNYVAVPNRSWQPRTLRIEVVRQVSWSDNGAGA